MWNMEYGLIPLLFEIPIPFTYKEGWDIRLAGADRLYLQIECNVGICARTSLPSNWRGRKWYLSSFMCRQEIVGTAFMAFKYAEMHECQEWFQLDGIPVYNPHVDPFKLVAWMQSDNQENARPGAMLLDDGAEWSNE